ncbi:MAG: Periplasmic binding protein, partial [Actinomycetota bacterium]|nr:Periplasmic binding protein [Actinomycetota bacterium]
MTDLPVPTETTSSGGDDFRQGMRLLMRSSGTKLLAGALTMALIFTMATLSVVEGNRKAKSTSTLQAIGGNGQPLTDANGNAITDANGNPVAGSSGSGASAAGATGSSGAAAGASGKALGATGGGTTTGCKDANPSQGVTCDLVLIGGITVLSGPLGIYGEQGLQGGQAWLSYFNSVYAPAHHLRKSKLIYYDDHGADPSQDATLTQRLVEQDHVFAIAGMPAPQGADPYLRQHRIPLIGDLGQNPISFQSP